jgi:glycosyltransferase involved in cell wall biosynthesis
MALRVAVATNVPPPVLRAYLSPLLQVAEVSEVVLIRDIANVDSAPKLRVVTPPAWWPRLLPMKIAARRFLFWWIGRSLRPDVLMVIHWFPDGPAMTRWARRYKAPLIVNIIGGPAELIDGGRRFALSSLPRWVKTALQGYQRRWLNRATVVTVTGERTRQWYRDNGLAKPPVVTLHAAIEPPPPDAGALPRAVDVAFVGRRDADKRVDRCFRVLHALGRRRAGTTAVVVGVRGVEINGVESYRAARQLLGDNLIVHARVESIYSLLCRTKILLVTSDTEGRTLAALEALACGAAVVATDVGDLEETITHSGGGITVPLGRDEQQLVDKLAECVLRLLGSEHERTAMADRGRGFVARMHSLRQATEDCENILRLSGAGQGRS